MTMPGPRPICLFTDFGVGSPYLGQMHAVLAAQAPGHPVIPLLSDAPAWRPDLAAYLLPALVRDIPADSVLICVVDPGVGTDRAALALEADGRWYVGPDNGLLALAARRASRARLLRIDWRPARLSDSFHGRDLFAPVGARLARGETLTPTPLDSGAMIGHDWPDDLPAVIYIDTYGNLLTGLRADSLPEAAVLEVGGIETRFARTFAEAPPGRPFWYRDSCGLVEVALDRARAADRLGVGVGAEIRRLR
ncbi:MAG: SAM-dependent chlorinase/fluorinase [Chromatiales bacterium]